MRLPFCLRLGILMKIHSLVKLDTSGLYEWWVKLVICRYSTWFAFPPVLILMIKQFSCLRFLYCVLMSTHMFSWKPDDCEIQSNVNLVHSFKNIYCFVRIYNHTVHLSTKQTLENKCLTFIKSWVITFNHSRTKRHTLPPFNEYPLLFHTAFKQTKHMYNF